MATERGMKDIRGAINEGSRMELGLGREAGSGQITMEFTGTGLRRERERRRLIR